MPRNQLASAGRLLSENGEYLENRKISEVLGKSREPERNRH